MFLERLALFHVSTVRILYSTMKKKVITLLSSDVYLRYIKEIEFSICCTLLYIYNIKVYTTYCWTILLLPFPGDVLCSPQKVSNDLFYFLI